MTDTIYRVKKLDEIIGSRGRVFMLLARGEKVAIYEVSDGAKLMGYEVIKIRLGDAKKMVESLEKRTGEKYQGSLLNFDKMEIYPSDKQFGYYGWFYMPEEKERAMKRYNDLLSNYNEDDLKTKRPTPDIQLSATA